MGTALRPDLAGSRPMAGCTGIGGGDPALLAFGRQATLKDDALSCSGVRNLALPRESMAEEVSPADGRRQELEPLCRQSVPDPIMWWENRRRKKSSRSPDLRRRGSGEGLWFDNSLNPAWVDAQLGARDTHVGLAASLSKSEPQRPAGSKVSVTAVTVSTLCQQGKLSEAVVALEELVETDFPNPQAFLFTVLKLCAAKKDLVLGRRVHDLTVKLGFETNTYLGNHILRMYACGGRLHEAMDVFTKVGKRDVFMWGSMMTAYAKHGKPNEAIQLYHEMCSSGVKPDAHIFVAALQACALAMDIESGTKVHFDVLQSGIPPNLFVGSCLVDMYAKCGGLEAARQVFDSLATKDVVTWTALIAGYANHGPGQEALVLYEQMEQEGLILDNPVTFACLLKACASANDLQTGRQLHSQILGRGKLQSDILVSNSLLDMYAKCGELELARRVFDSLDSKDVVTWTALIAGYTNHGFGEEALVLYGRMEQEGLILGNHVTFACLLKACASTRALCKGRELHSQIVGRRLLENVVVANCLVDMYIKCGELEDARRVFDSLTRKDVVTWNALIAGFAQQGLCHEALALYGEMERGGLILANHITFTCLLNACASAGAMHEGRQLHLQIVERGELERDILVGNCLVDMYAKCGELEEARRVFDSLSAKDVVTWNALIDGYGTSDQGHNALACFEEMIVAGVEPNDATFTCLLVACAHTGLVNEGRKLFGFMVEHHGIKPTLQHHNCMIDLLGRAGHLDEAESILLSCDSRNNVVGLTSLLNSCKSHGDIERATRSFECLVTLDPQRASSYVLLANVYADAGRWTDVDRIERQRLAAGARKKPAVAGIEVKGQVHTFVVGEHRDISPKVDSMNVHLNEEGGHVPHTKLVLKPLSEKEKEDALCGHAEKLALAYGLLNTPSGTPLLVTKNLRMCGDCHSSTAIMSKVEKREIVVRDAYRVHRFTAGSCSCNGRP